MGKYGAKLPDDLVREVVSHLRVRFGDALTAEEREDLAQSAYCELLDKERAGEVVSAPLALTKRIAWRDARDLLRDRREAATDPSAPLFLALRDPGATPEGRLLARAALARAVEAVEQLDEPHRAAYRACIAGLAPRPASLALGIPRSTYCYRLRGATNTLEATVDGARFQVLEATLLSAYVAGIASVEERRRAERLVSADPHAAAVARRLRKLRAARCRPLAPGARRSAPPSQRRLRAELVRAAR